MAAFPSTLPLPGAYLWWAAGMGLRCLPGGSLALPCLQLRARVGLCVFDHPPAPATGTGQRSTGLQGGESTGDSTPSTLGQFTAPQEREGMCKCCEPVGCFAASRKQARDSISFSFQKILAQP